MFISRMFRSLALIVALSMLPACSTLDSISGTFSTITGADVPASAVIVARDAFNLSEAAATSYMRLPRCSGSNGPVCRDPTLFTQIDGAIRSGRSARNRLAALQRANPGGAIPVADYTTLTSATGVINDLTAAYRAATGK